NDRGDRRRAAGKHRRHRSGHRRFTVTAGMDEAAALRRRVAELVSTASSGAVSVAAALAGEERLGDLGLDSLGLLRLVDAVEVECGVELDLADGAGFSTVDAIVQEIAAAAGGRR